MASVVLILVVWLAWSCWRRGQGLLVLPIVGGFAVLGIAPGLALASLSTGKSTPEMFAIGLLANVAFGLMCLRAPTLDDFAEGARLLSALTRRGGSIMRFADRETLSELLSAVEDETLLKYVAVRPSPQRESLLVFENFVEVEEDDDWQSVVLVVAREMKVSMARYYKTDCAKLYAPRPVRAIDALIVRRPSSGAEWTLECVADEGFCWRVRNVCLDWLTTEGFRCVDGVWTLLACPAKTGT